MALAVIDLRDDVKLSEVITNGANVDHLQKHERWSIACTNKRLGRTGAAMFFVASRDDGQCIIAARNLFSLMDAIRETAGSTVPNRDIAGTRQFVRDNPGDAIAEDIPPRHRSAISIGDED